MLKADITALPKATITWTFESRTLQPRAGKYAMSKQVSSGVCVETKLSFSQLFLLYTVI